MNRTLAGSGMGLFSFCFCIQPAPNTTTPNSEIAVALFFLMVRSILISSTKIKNRKKLSTDYADYAESANLAWSNEQHAFAAAEYTGHTAGHQRRQGSGQQGS